MFTTSYLYLTNPHYVPLLESEGIEDPESLDRWSGHGESISRSSTSEVWRQALGGTVVYVKRRVYVPPSSRYWGRAGRGHCEWRNYENLRRLGLRCPELLCLGEKRNWGRLRWSILVTREVTGSASLLERFREDQSRLSEELRRKILGQLGFSLRRLHDRHFVLRDGKLRNILLVETGKQDFHLYFVDCPRGGFRYLFRRSAVRRDLARLKRDVLKTCSRGDWEKLLQAYSSVPDSVTQKE